MNELPERVQETLDEAKERAASEARDQVHDLFETATRQGVESPIELLFLAAFATVWQMDPMAYVIDHQVEIGRYRADFVVTFKMAPYEPIRVVVECDGHDFHEKTKEQAEHDKRRDRFMTAQGFTVMRFTGRELWRDPFACVEEIVDYTQDVMVERQQEARKRRAEGAQRAAETRGDS